MKITKTLALYVTRKYVLNFLIILGGLLSIIFLFDMVELIRRGSKFSDVPFSLMLQMGLLKLPEVGQLLFPFAILFGAIYTFWQLNKRSELVIVRTSGFSIWQFLMPILIASVMISTLHVTVVNPLSSIFLEQFEKLENKYLKRQNSEVAVLKQGFWLRQDVAQDGHYVILHARKVQQPGWNLGDVMILHFDSHDNFVQRIDAKEGRLTQDQWVFEQATNHETNTPNMSYTLQTSLTSKDIEESFSSPETLSFWRLPGHIQTLQETGFDSTKLRVHYYSLLVEPLLFMSMVLLGACVSLRPPRNLGNSYFIAAGIFTGLGVFFLSSFLQALGATGQLPVTLAALAPSLITSSLAVSILINFEDG